jgi:hypothetical protein
MPVDFEHILRTYFCAFVNNIPVAPCPNQWVGTVDLHGHVNGNGPETAFVRKRIEDRDRNAPALFLILESPHRKEYAKRRGQWHPVGPANGSTGDKIRDNLKRFDPPFSFERDRSLLLMNAVQHQCSAGVAPTAHRDALFRACWNAGGADHFRDRLKEAFVPGDIIINACTVGKRTKKDTLKVLVERQIRAAVEQPSDFWTHHPSSWWRQQHRVPLLVPETLPAEDDGRATSAPKKTGLRSAPPSGSTR